MPCTKFNIRTRKTNHFFRVMIFDTKKEMYEYFYKYCNIYWLNIEEGINWAARCIPYEIIDIHPDKEEKRRNDIGTILFYKKRIGSGVIAHEVLHASLHYDRVINGNKNAQYGSGDENNTDNEERLALVHGDLYRSFVVKAYKTGVW